MTDTTDQTSDKAPPLTPMSLPMLLERIEHEWTTRKRIFDLPTARFWKPSPDVDLSFEFLGRPAASPVGPAAGPHSQMAQNIVLSWLGGSRPATPLNDNKDARGRLSNGFDASFRDLDVCVRL